MSGDAVPPEPGARMDEQRSASGARISPWRALGMALFGLAGWASVASAVSVNGQLFQQMEQSSTSCVLNDGFLDYPFDLSADQFGCRWRKRVLVPEAIRVKVSTVRALVRTDGYFGSWSVGLVDPATDGVVGAGGVNLLAGNHVSFDVPLAQVVDSSGGVKIDLTGGAFAGTWISFASSGIEVTYDDSTPPILVGPAPAMPTDVAVFSEIPPLKFSIVDDSMFSASKPSTISWGDGVATSYTPAQTSWTPNAPIAVAIDGHAYSTEGDYAPMLRLADGVGNQVDIPLGLVRVVDVPVLLRPLQVIGKRRVGGRLTCVASFSGRPTGVLYVWYRDGRLILRSSKRDYVAVRKDRGRRLACRAFASNIAGQSERPVAPSRPVKVG